MNYILHNRLQMLSCITDHHWQIKIKMLNLNKLDITKQSEGDREGAREIDKE